MNSRMFANGSFFPLKSARRSATVTISAPLASRASRIVSGDENLPVPRISRERKIRTAIISGCVDKFIHSNSGAEKVLVERSEKDCLHRAALVESHPRPRRCHPQQ